MESRICSEYHSAANTHTRPVKLVAHVLLGAVWRLVYSFYMAHVLKRIEDKHGIYALDQSELPILPSIRTDTLICDMYTRHDALHVFPRMFHMLTGGVRHDFVERPCNGRIQISMNPVV